MIIISWLVIGVVVYALAQFAMLRRLREEEELELLRQQELATPTNFLSPPTTAVTPPTPQNGTIPPLPPQVASLNSEKSGSPRSMWLPSVGALQLSESSILKRRASLKRQRKCNRQVRQCSVDCETLTWIERGLDRLYSEADLMANVVNKWHAFLKTRVMQDITEVNILETQFALHHCVRKWFLKRSHFRAEMKAEKKVLLS